MSSPSKKRRKSFLNKLRRVFKKRDDELGEYTESYRKESFDNRRNISQNSDGKVALQSAEQRETCTTSVKSNLSGKESNDNNLSNVQDGSSNVIVKNEYGRLNVVENDKNVECRKYSATQNKQEHTALGSDRYMSTKITFLNQSNDAGVSSHLENTDKLRGREAENIGSDSKRTMLQSPSNDINITNDTRKLLVKETKAIFQESSEDSDFSADSTEDSFEESSEDENERLIESERTQKYFKDEYFTKGKYITYFFLEMERQFYNPAEVYSMIQYHNTDCEKPGKEGTK